jgi:DNA-binding CsgD family transcriptional regulator
MLASPMGDRQATSRRGATGQRTPSNGPLTRDQRPIGQADHPRRRSDPTAGLRSRDIAGELALLNPAGSFAHRCAFAVGALDTLDATLPASWLRGAASLVELVGEGKAVEIWTCRFIPPSRRWRSDQAVVTNGFNERIERGLAELILRDCPLQDPGFALPPGGAWIKPRRELVHDDSWRAAERRKIRTALGVDEYIQAGFRYQSGAFEQALVVQLSAPVGHPAPMRDIEGLASVAPFIFRAYHRRFVALEALRAGLLSALKPGERSLPELLVQGMSEREAGERLGRSRHTVHEKVRSIYKAWGVTSRFELVEVWNGLRPAQLVPCGATGLATPRLDGEAGEAST